MLKNPPTFNDDKSCADPAPCDIGKLLTDIFKDPTNAHGLLVSYGYEIHFPAVYQWFYRAAIPSKWILTLLGIYEMENGRPASLTAYLR